MWEFFKNVDKSLKMWDHWAPCICQFTVVMEMNREANHSVHR